ncbi:MAG TPA: hypothetical protein VHB47_03065 [Thermoanaerobaculia bacterium]|jgi:hypothetical protein|nr:hypothetical protein [Thermoanaerobaculia bacterium]
MRRRDVSFAPIAPFGWLAAALAVLCMSACGGRGGGGGPTMPSGADSYALSAAMKNASGADTILEATIRLDGFTVADSCNPYLEPVFDADGNVIGYICSEPAAAAVKLSAGGSIGPGSHRLEFFLVSQAQTTPAPYTVPAFTLAIKGPDGKLLATVNLPSQTASLGAGQSIVYPVSF